jgi:FkbM family methyltransferase
MSRLAGIMGTQGKKNFFRRLLNIGILFRYIGESASIVMQGARLGDKLILFSYYMKIPLIVVRSLASGKTFRELEEEKKMLRGDVTISNRYGRFFCGNNILTVYTVNRNNEKHLYRWIDAREGIFIDVGAHIGKYSIPVAKNPGVIVVAVEPDTYNYQLLKKNAALNDLQNIIFINKGAFSSPGNIPFFTTDRGEGMHSLYPQSGSRQQQMIEVDTLDNIIEQLQLDKSVSLVKIDVEGAELEVLKGAEKILQKYQPDLIIEVWSNNSSNFEQVKAFLQRFGYEFAHIVDGENVRFSTRGNWI